MAINILGINISTNSQREILQKISYFLLPTSSASSKACFLVTPNPEFLVAIQHDEEFFYILNQADLSVPDGVGLALAARLLGQKLKRITGVDLMLDVCRLAQEQNKSIYLVGGAAKTAERAAEKLQKLFPKLKIAGAAEGLRPGEWQLEAGRWLKGEEENAALVKIINQAKPDILFVAFGHPRQEKWLYHNLPLLCPPLAKEREGWGGVKVAVGVGGSFDFISGNITRAPKFLRVIGLEWCWRLLQEPRKRLPRIYDAVIKFPLVFFKWYCIAPYFYRPNVACLLYKKENGIIKILLAERREDKNHWQLPQGGTDGEDFKTAGSRELREEIGTDKFKPVKTFKNVYRYKFTDDNGQGDTISRGVKVRQALGYKGQKQGLFVAEFTGADSDITINFWDHSNWKWVDLNDVVSEVHEIRKEATKIFGEKFKTLL